MKALLRSVLSICLGPCILGLAAFMSGCGGTTGSGQTTYSRYARPVTSPQPAGTPSGAAPTSSDAASTDYQTPSTTETLGGLSSDTIRVGDKLTVRLSDIPAPPDPIEQRVREDGNITLLLGVQIKAVGKKAGELETEIQQAYVPKYYRRLTVNVKCEERVFYVDGEVRKPDRYIYAGEMTVLKAISTAGGFTEFAKKNKVEVTHASGGKPIVVDCVKALRSPKLDIPIYPGDRIFVHKRIWL